jgi:hypothetical protein
MRARSALTKIEAINRTAGLVGITVIANALTPKWLREVTEGLRYCLV